MVIERVEARRDKIAARVGGSLDTKPFSKLIRSGTWADHGRAEGSDFEQALVYGTVSREAYRDLLGQLWFVYKALEERALELSGDPVVAPFIDPVLNRLALIERDLEHFYGPLWRDNITPIPVSLEYAERIRTASPARFVAHHYTRYLADLSGGQDIQRGLAKGFGEATEGLRFYVFDIPDVMAFKVGYREKLDSIAVSTEDKLTMIEEVALAYEYNIEMVADLAIKHDVKAPEGAEPIHHGPPRDATGHPGNGHGHP
jgi:heme oxygenase